MTINLLYSRMSGFQIIAGGIRTLVMPPYSDSFQAKLKSFHSYAIVIIPYIPNIPNIGLRWRFHYSVLSR